MANSEETKPVEREAFDEFLESRRMRRNDVLADAFKDFWDAALERAADEADAKLKHFGVGGLVRVPVRNAIRALKGRE